MRGLPRGPTVAIVCAACSQVARVAVQAAAAQGWTCPACGAVREGPVAGLAGGLIEAPALGAVFSETYEKPRRSPAPR